jgi:hypothetical protein
MNEFEDSAPAGDTFMGLICSDNAQKYCAGDLLFESDLDQTYCNLLMSTKMYALGRARHVPHNM